MKRKNDQFGRPRISLAIIVFLFPFAAFAQYNLVNNGDFEGPGCNEVPGAFTYINPDNGCLRCWYNLEGGPAVFYKTFEMFNNSIQNVISGNFSLFLGTGRDAYCANNSNPKNALSSTGAFTTVDAKKHKGYRISFDIWSDMREIEDISYFYVMLGNDNVEDIYTDFCEINVQQFGSQRLFMMPTDGPMHHNITHVEIYFTADNNYNNLLFILEPSLTGLYPHNPFNRMLIDNVELYEDCDGQRTYLQRFYPDLADQQTQFYGNFIKVGPNTPDGYMFDNIADPTKHLIAGKYIEVRPPSLIRSVTQFPNSNYLLEVRPCKYESVISCPKVPAQKLLVKRTISSQLNFEKYCNIFPNPVTEILKIEIQDIQDGTVEILDATGRLIHNENLHSDLSTIDASRWQRGMYLVKVYNKNQLIQVSKIVKLH